LLKSGRSSLLIDKTKKGLRMTPHSVPFRYHILDKLRGALAGLIVLQRALWVLFLPIFALFILAQAAEIEQQADTIRELRGESPLYLPIVIKSEPPTATPTPTVTATPEPVACDIAGQTNMLI
jgi:hypothetical protein